MAVSKVLTGKKTRVEDIFAQVQKPTKVETNIEESKEIKENKEISKERKAVQMIDETKTPKQASITLMDIPVSIIKDRKENKFIISLVEELAEDIRKNGLLQNIIVTEDPEAKDDELSYICCVGHRRLAAYKYLYEKYGSEYAYIRASVLRFADNEAEMNAYLSSNSQARKTSLFEMVANLNPENFNFDNEQFKKEYNKKIYGTEVAPKSENYSNISRAVYVTKVLEETFPGVETTSEAIRKYLRLYDKATDELKSAIYNNKISVREANRYIALDKQEQIEALLSENPRATFENMLIKKQRINTGIKPKKLTPKQEADECVRKLSKFSETIIKICKDANTIEVNNLNEKQIEAIRELEKAINKFKQSI